MWALGVDIIKNNKSVRWQHTFELQPSAASLKYVPLWSLWSWIATLTENSYSLICSSSWNYFLPLSREIWACHILKVGCPSLTGMRGSDWLDLGEYSAVSRPVCYFWSWGLYLHICLGFFLHTSLLSFQWHLTPLGRFKADPRSELLLIMFTAAWGCKVTDALAQMWRQLSLYCVCIHGCDFHTLVTRLSPHCCFCRWHFILFYI